MMMKKEKTAGKAKTVGTLFTGDDLKKLIFPLIIEQILAVSVGMVDNYDGFQCRLLACGSP